MAHGHPDYGQDTSKETIHAVTDIGELAVRLGSIVSYDRRGDVIFLEDFSGDLGRWISYSPPAGFPAVISSERFRSHGFSCKVTTNADLLVFSGIQKYLPLPVYAGIGLEVSFSIDRLVTDIEIYIRVHDGADYYQFKAHLAPTTGQLWITNEAGGEVEVGRYGRVGYEETQFHTLKLVGDYTTNMYKRVLFNEFSKDLSAYKGYTTGSGADKELQILIVAGRPLGAGQLCWFDDVIVTQNEP